MYSPNYWFTSVKTWSNIMTRAAIFSEFIIKSVSEKASNYACLYPFLQNQPVTSVPETKAGKMW